jgi:transcriptional regulator with XRE-family HTH domain
MDLIEIGKKIKEEREKKFLTQEELAEKLDMKKQTISNIENGIRAISMETAKKILNVLGFDLQVVVKKIKK